MTSMMANGKDKRGEGTNTLTYFAYFVQIDGNKSGKCNIECAKHYWNSTKATESTFSLVVKENEKTLTDLEEQFGY